MQPKRASLSSRQAQKNRQTEPQPFFQHEAMQVACLAKEFTNR